MFIQRCSFVHTERDIDIAVRDLVLQNINVYQIDEIGVGVQRCLTFLKTEIGEIYKIHVWYWLYMELYQAQIEM